MTSRPFAGPVPVLTVAEANRILPLLRACPDMSELARKLERAVNADPAWRRPVR